MAMVNLVKDGKGYRVPEENLQKALAKGYSLPSQEEAQKFESINNNQINPQAALIQSGQMQPYEAQQQPQKQGFLQNIDEAIKNNPIGNLAVGAGDALFNQIANVANLIPGVDISPRRASEGMMYDIGNIGGNLAGFIGGGGALNLARKGAENIPGVVGQLSKMLGGEGLSTSALARQGAGSGVYGFTQTPEDRLKGLTEGVGWSLGLGGAQKLGSKLFPSAPNMTEEIHREANNILQGLTKGMKPEEIGKSIASDIATKGQENIATSTGQYNKFFNKVGNEPFFDKEMVKKLSQANKEIKLAKKSEPDINPSFLKNAIYKKYGIDDKEAIDIFKMPSKLKASMGPGSKKQLKLFMKDPTIKNAHELQSELGFDIRNFNKLRNLKPSETHELADLKKARKLVKNEMDSFLESKNPDLIDEYKQITNWYKGNVVPYSQDKKIAEIVKEITDNPRNIETIFKNPSNKNSINKILKDNPEISDKIAASQIGKVSKKNPEQQLLDSIMSMENRGLGSYVNPKLKEQAAALKDKIASNKEAIEAKKTKSKATHRIIGGLSGALLGSKTAIPHAMELGAAGGALLGPLIGRLGNIESLRRFDSPFYNKLKEIYLANNIGTPTDILINKYNSRGNQ